MRQFSQPITLTLGRLVCHDNHVENTNLKKTISELPEKPADRERFSIYVSKSTWLRFKKRTAKVGTSAALERLMELGESEKKGA